MPTITPCLWFDDQGEQAAQLYTSLVPNSRITNITRFGPGGMRPEGTVMTVQFELDGREYVALNGGPQFPQTEAFSLQLFCASQEEVDHYWEHLTADGGVESQCGWLKDRFGVSWQVIPTALGELLGDPEPERARRATEAMLGMKKIDIAEIRRAAAGDQAG
jgi:predicted 3-demethylubiquinone-9 3-methyltransferase (glyoxalase superfamily)